MSGEFPADLPAEVVAGIVTMVKAIAKWRAEGGGNRPDCSEAYAGKSERAQMYILEFYKDVAPFISDAKVKEVVEGNYSWVWKMVNLLALHPRNGQDSINNR